MEIKPILLLLVLILIIPDMRTAFLGVPVCVKPKASRGRIKYFDFLKGVSIIAVIIIHVGYMFLTFYENPSINFLNHINNVLRFAVPFFFIISGILIRDKVGTLSEIKQFYIKKIVKIFIPFLIANVIVALMYSRSFSVFFVDLIIGNGSPPYYFIIVLLQFYLLYPLLVRQREKGWFLPLVLVFSVLVFYLESMGEPTTFPFFGKYLFFFAYGLTKREYYLSEKVKSMKLYWLTIIVAYLLLLFVFDGYYYNTRYVYAIALFNLIFESKDKLMVLHKPFAWTGRYSLWIYLTHLMVVLALYYLLVSLGLGFIEMFGLLVALSVPLSVGVGYVSDVVYNMAFKTMLPWSKYGEKFV